MNLLPFILQRNKPLNIEMIKIIIEDSLGNIRNIKEEDLNQGAIAKNLEDKNQKTIIKVFINILFIFLFISL